MEEKRIINNESYFTVQGWAVNELNLKGYELLVYSLIYGFSQDGESKFNGSRKYLAEWLGVSLPTVDKTLANLIKKELIIKEQKVISGVTFNSYYANLGVVKNFYRGCKKSLYNNIEDSINNMNIIYNWENYEICDCKTQKNEKCLRRSSYKINGTNYCNQHAKKILGSFFNDLGFLNEEIKQDKKEFVKPTIEEIEAYCMEKGYNIDVKKFYDYYDVADWKDSSGKKVKNWKQRVISWNNKSFNNNQQQPKKQEVFIDYAN